MLKNLLKNIWLSENEINVYLSCLKIWVTDARKIIEDTKIARTQIYPILSNLWKKSLISEVIWGDKKKYIAEDISAIKNLLLQEKELLNAKIKMIDTNASEFEKFIDIDKYKTITKYYEDKQWVQKIYDSAFLWDFDCFSDLWRVNKYFPWSNVWIWSINKLKKVKSRNILSNNAVAQWWISETKNISWIETKLLDIWQEIKVDKILYDNKVAYISFTKWIISWIVIENKDIYESAKLQFKLLWDRLN